MLPNGSQGYCDGHCGLFCHAGSFLYKRDRLCLRGKIDPTRFDIFSDSPSRLEFHESSPDIFVLRIRHAHLLREALQKFPSHGHKNHKNFEHFLFRPERARQAENRTRGLSRISKDIFNAKHQEFYQRNHQNDVQRQTKSNLSHHSPISQYLHGDFWLCSVILHHSAF